MKYSLYGNRIKNCALIGSVKDKKVFSDLAIELAKERVNPLLPIFNPTEDDITDEYKRNLMMLGYQRILISDTILVVNPGRFPGEDTMKELAFAYAVKSDYPKTIRFLDENFIPDELNVNITMRDFLDMAYVFADSENEDLTKYDIEIYLENSSESKSPRVDLTDPISMKKLSNLVVPGYEYIKPASMTFYKWEAYCMLKATE